MFWKILITNQLKKTKRQSEHFKTKKTTNNSFAFLGNKTIPFKKMPVLDLKNKDIKKK
jgi:hypothetical protein